MKAAFVPPGVRAASALRRLPLRFDAVEEAAAGDPLERGWISGLREAAELTRRLASGPLRWGIAFGTRWPYVEGDGWIVAPGVPVMTSVESAEGPDGVYRLTRDGILRESCGTESIFLETGASGAAVGRTPDLLWFGVTERYALTGGTLEVEDLFSRVVAPASGAVLEELLARKARVPRAVFEGLPRGPATVAASVEVGRPLELVPEVWRDPAAVLSRREGVRSARFRGDLLELVLEDGTSVECVVTQEETGWRADVVRGAFVWPRIRAAASDGVLRYRVEPAPELDPLDTGVRTRIAFDLLSDLVLLSRTENG